MNPFPTPASHSDGFTDATRPDGYIAQLQLGGGQFGSFTWSRTLQCWTLVPGISVQPASPFNSPPLTYTVPILITRHQSASSTNARNISFPPLVQCPLPSANYTARMMLDAYPPLSRFGATGIVFNSSAANQHYGLIAPLKYWPLPQTLEGYESLSNDEFYQAVPGDPLAGILTEGDTIYAVMNAIFHPVNSVLHRNCYGQTLLTSSEDSHSAKVMLPDGKTGEHLSRVDRSWSILHGQDWTKFAVMEFKRPGALNPLEWNDAIINGTAVDGKGGKVCRQLKKYGYSCGTPFVGCCDGNVLVVLCLGGQQSEWFHAIPLAAPQTPAHVRWIDKVEEMKRNLFVFLREALKWKLRQLGLLAV